MYDWKARCLVAWWNHQQQQQLGSQAGSHRSLPGDWFFVSICVFFVDCGRTIWDRYSEFMIDYWSTALVVLLRTILIIHFTLSGIFRRNFVLLDVKDTIGRTLRLVGPRQGLQRRIENHAYLYER